MIIIVSFTIFIKKQIMALNYLFYQKRWLLRLVLIIWQSG